jgi:hypothetical protein
VEHLAVPALESYGTRAWSRQHRWVEQLNLQAHHCAIAHTDDFVTAALLTHRDALPVLVQCLLVCEVWKERVMPHLAVDMAQCTGVRAHSMVYHEASLVGLLEVVMHNPDCLEAIGSDLTVELIDYCHRRATDLVARPELAKAPASYPLVGASPTDVAAQTEAESWQRRVDEITFSVALSSLSILRYITDGLGKLPLQCVTRAVETCDLACALVPLVERPPWTQRVRRPRPAGPLILKWAGNKWTEVPASDARRLCQPEAQTWLALGNLLCEPEARRAYPIDARRRDTLARLRPYLTDALRDQLPVASEVLRAVEEAQVAGADADGRGAARGTGVTVEVVAAVREALLRSCQDAEAFAATHRDALFGEGSAAERAEEMQEFARLYSLDAIEDMLERPVCGKCGAAAVKRCSRCHFQWYCGRECQVNDWKAHKSVCDMLRVSREEKEKEKEKEKEDKETAAAAAAAK